MSIRTKSSRRVPLAAFGVSLSIVIAACGGSGGSSSKVATLNNASAGATTTTVKVNTQEALLAYAACMRDNGVNMADPTFDANGNPTGGGFGGGGANSNIDRRSTAFQTAQKACASHLQGVTFGGRRGGNFDRQAVQDGLNKFTACLRDNGLTVDDITFGRPRGATGTGNGGGGGGGGGGFGGPPGTDQAGAPPADGSLPPGGFGGSPGTGAGRGANGPGGAGFDPTARIIERLKLDKTDPAVVKALAACQSILSSAFTPTSTTTTTPAG